MISREQVRRSKRVERGVDTEPERIAVNAANGFEDSPTVLEGLSAVENTEGEEAPTVRAHEAYASDPSPSYASGLYAIPEEEKETNKWLLGALWIISLTAVGLLTYYVASKDEESVQLRADNTVVAVSEGPFVKGLGEQVRAFILMSCFRVQEDEDACEESKLLKGEFPEETVELKAFKLDTHEVTFKRYDACVSAGKCSAVNFKDCKVYTSQGLQVGIRVPKSLQEPQMPAVCLKREDAEAYCKFADGRLPTHEEWEKAARSDTSRLFPWGDSWVPDAANWGETDVVQTPIPGKIDGFEWSAPPAAIEDGKGPFGHFDLAGNVFEWVQGDDPIKGHVRGGSWASSPFDLRTTAKTEMEAGTLRADVGFRCAYD